ncbi:MAG: sulfite exporter TauE/SafE family protein [Alphaproteobacteria bacterium]|nr:sulfite exporter TauE/SafE family protein [Alphaproteobacteria bacterium]
MEFLIQDTGLSAWAFIGLCAISFVGSFIAAALGLGGGMLVLAVMALVLPPTVLIPVHGVVQFGSNLGRAVLMARSVLYAVVPAFVIGSVIGAAIGARLVIALPLWLLLAVLGLFVLYGTWSPGFRSSRPGPMKFLAVGGVSSFVTMFVGATGPLIAPFVAAACGDRRQVVSTHAMLMSVQHGIKVLAFGILGFAFGPYVPLLAGLLAFGFLGTYVGGRVLLRLPERIFRLGLRLILTLLALRLFYDSFGAYSR